MDRVLSLHHPIVFGVPPIHPPGRLEHTWDALSSASTGGIVTRIHRWKGWVVTGRAGWAAAARVAGCPPCPPSVRAAGEATYVGVARKGVMVIESRWSQFTSECQRL